MNKPTRSRLVCLLMLLCLLLCLNGCTVWKEMNRTQSEVRPDLRLLERPAYHEAEAAEEASSSSVLRMDLWLDATQVMGGININEESMYPHFSRMYREGGFHYRTADGVGLYEELLHCMLTSVEGSRVRLLRYGNERITDEFLLQERVAPKNASAEALRSIRRDMLTYAIDPMPTVFESFSKQSMNDSFYALGTPMLNRMRPLNGRLLENPSLENAMDNALDELIKQIADDQPGVTALGDNLDYALLYALENIDLSHLSVITCDPAAIRRASAVTGEGVPVDLIETVLRERGVYDAGLSVGVYAFTLDYMGQLSSFGAADLSEPLLWGRMKYNPETRQSEGTLPMPRTLLTFVVGTAEQMQQFTDALEETMTQSAVLKEKRGPAEEELSYNANGQTVIQQPFAFDWEYAQFDRPKVDVFTQKDAGFVLKAKQADNTGVLPLVILSPEDGEHPDHSFSIKLPDTLAAAPWALCNMQLNVSSALLLSDIADNHPDTVVPENAQTIALRDRLYVFTPQENPDHPFTCSGVKADWCVDITADGSALIPGYYRLCLTADLDGSSLSWPDVPWIREKNASLSNTQIALWEAFSAVLTEFERERSTPSNPFQHAWGDAGFTSYRGTEVPAFPPVTKAPGLNEVVDQIRSAAAIETAPRLTYVFDVFVTY